MDTHRPTAPHDPLRHSPFSDPGDLDTTGLPRDPERLALLVREVIVHRAEGWRTGWHPPPEDRWHDDPGTRYAAGILRVLHERSGGLPLTASRPPFQRFVGTCRDFSLLLCALLRSTGTAARLRCGFATYLVPGWYEDHWLTEYRLPDGSWRLVDVQVAHPAYEVPFSPFDVDRDRFVVAGDAWRMCREGGADARSFGVDGVPHARGLAYVRGNVLADLAAVNGVELLPWDVWGREVPDGDGLTGEDLALADAVAAAGTDEELSALRRDPRLRVPRVVRSYDSRTGYTVAREVVLPG